MIADAFLEHIQGHNLLVNQFQKKLLTWYNIPTEWYQFKVIYN